MATIVYSPSERTWAGVLDTPVLRGIPVFVETSGPDTSPSTTQLRAVAAVESLSAKTSDTIDNLLRDWVASEWEPDLQEDLEPEDFEWEVMSVRIPNVTLLADTYFLVHLRCELEPEHGIGIACRNGQAFAVCHPGSYSTLNSDDESSLDAPFSHRSGAG